MSTRLSHMVCMRLGVVDFEELLQAPCRAVAALPTLVHNHDTRASHEKFISLDKIFNYARPLHTCLASIILMCEVTASCVPRHKEVCGIAPHDIKYCVR